jgi:hypothetical protein
MSQMADWVAGTPSNPGRNIGVVASGGLAGVAAGGLSLISSAEPLELEELAELVLATMPSH